MNTYLAIITSVLVLTQIIRIIQNTINLHRQNEEIRRNISWVEDAYPEKADFETQREVYRLLKVKLELELNEEDE